MLGSLDADYIFRILLSALGAIKNNNTMDALDLYVVSTLMLFICYAVVFITDIVEEKSEYRFFKTKRHSLMSLVFVLIWPLYVVYHTGRTFFNYWKNLPDE